MDGTDALTVSELIADLEITRVCHLTPFTNLLQLAYEDAGLMSLKMIAEAGGDFDQQDLERLDGHPDHLSCSIEYPNFWYLRSRRKQATLAQLLFPDWVCLTFDPSYLARDTTRVCIRNASARHGAFINDISVINLSALYGSPIVGSGNRTYVRTEARLRACPTDDQAEVLIHRFVPYAAIREIIVPCEADARRMYAGLLQTDRDVSPTWVVAPDLFTENLSNMIRVGARPTETVWNPDDA